MDHKLIEHVLAIINTSEDSPKKFDSSPLTDPHSLLTAREIIQFMDEMPGGFLIYHADGDEQIIYANKGLLRIFRCENRKEFRALTGNSFRGMVYAEDLDAVEKSIWEQISLSQYDLDYVEYRIICKDGSVRWIEDYGHFIHSESVGDIFYVFLADATEKRKRQISEHSALLSAKNENERKLQTLIQEYDKEKSLIIQEQLRRLEVIEGLSINYESILYADLDENKILPYRLSRRTRTQFEKKYQVRDYLWFASDYVNTWVHPEDREAIADATTPESIRSRLSEDKTFYLNYRVLDHGETLYMQLRIVNVGHGENISQIVMGHRRVDEEIRREMEQNKLLSEALNSANLANIAKNTFLSNMSHDMRTPLNAILGYTELARKYNSDPKAVQDYLDKIEDSGRQLLELIEKVLELSWMESKDIRIVDEECCLSDILQDVHNTLLSQAAIKNIAFSLDISGIMHQNVYSDKDKLRQLLLILTDNAIKYTKNNGNVTLKGMELETLPNDYALYQFVIHDNGVGISKDFLQHIFDPFERENNTTFSKIHGSGLGLTIAKNIADLMGGKIQIDSTSGIGSTFTFTLRLHFHNCFQPDSPNPENVRTYLSGKKILLVEDNEINREIETEILQDLGFLIDTAADGRIAVEKISTSKPEDYGLILMDIQMPVMNGLEAAESIRRLKNPGLSHIPIIALSANAFESDRQRSIESGMNAHLTKPLDVPLLLETIARILHSLPDS